MPHARLISYGGITGEAVIRETAPGPAARTAYKKIAPAEKHGVAYKRPAYYNSRYGYPVVAITRPAAYNGGLKFKRAVAYSFDGSASDVGQLAGRDAKIEAKKSSLVKEAAEKKRAAKAEEVKVNAARAEAIAQKAAKLAEKEAEAKAEAEEAAAEAAEEAVEAPAAEEAPAEEAAE